VTNKIELTMGVVGTRAYEMQAWRSQGCSAVEQAVWASNTDMSIVTPVEKSSDRSRLRRALDILARVWSGHRSSADSRQKCE
jgi:hypothetical protein